MPKKVLWAVNMAGTMLWLKLAVKGGLSSRHSALNRRGKCGIRPLTRFSCAFNPSHNRVSVPALTARQPNRRNLCTETAGLRGNGLSFMTVIRFSALAACLLASVALAKAETRTFILDSSEGYGIDNCLINSESCGKAMATAVCKSHQFASAVDFGRLDPTEITGSVPGGIKVKACAGAKCPEKVAITCTR